jgi:hypothetical protein
MLPTGHHLGIFRLEHTALGQCTANGGGQCPLDASRSRTF